MTWQQVDRGERRAL